MPHDEERRQRPRVDHRPKLCVTERANPGSPDWESAPIPVPLGITRFSVDLIGLDDLGTGTVEVVWSLSEKSDPLDGASLAKYRAFPDAVEMSKLVPYVLNKSAAGVGYLKVRTKVVDDSLSGDVKMVVLLY